jgi:transposase InsO family protein
MRDNSFDRTVERNYIQKWRFLIREYEAVKAGRSAHFTRVGEFYRHHGTCSQTFRKYYNRFLQSGGSEAELIPQRRGPRWKTRRMAAEVEDIVLQERARGLNRYEIHAILCQRVAPAPSVSAIYRAMVRHGVNRRPKAVEEKRRIIKTAIGELGHADLHRLSRDIFLHPPAQEVHVLSVIDACSRLAWAGLVTGKKALPVMFRALAVINTLHQRYGVQFAELITDNGAEFASRKRPQEHPFELMLSELGIKHRYTRPYRPQTNGKVERFWRTLEDDLVEGTTFANLDEFATELGQFLIYYNDFRPHQALAGATPRAFAESLQKPDTTHPQSAN